jgi:uracil-DNA glycosylase family 4
MTVLPEGQTSADVAVAVSPDDLVMVLGEAPGAVEQERGKPFVGGSGELLHSMLKECGLESYYVSNIAKHQPYKDRQGKQQAPDATVIKACSPFLKQEFALIKPAKLILLGKSAAKLVCEGNFSMGKVVNQNYEYKGVPSECRCIGISTMQGCPQHDSRGRVSTQNEANDTIKALVLYHPAHFLYNRTAPWIQKQMADWKRAVRMFLGDRPPTYQIEKVECETHD